MVPNSIQLEMQQEAAPCLKYIICLHTLMMYQIVHQLLQSPSVAVLCGVAITIFLTDGADIFFQVHITLFFQ